MKTFTIKITDLCNNTCNFCNSFNKTGTFINEVDIDVIISFLKKQLKEFNLVITGGEPTIIKTLPKIISKLRLNFPDINISLNSNFQLKPLAYYKNLSIDHYSLTLHTEFVTNIQDWLDKYKKLKLHKCVEAFVMLTDDNVNIVEKIIEMDDTIKISPIHQLKLDTTNLNFNFNEINEDKTEVFTNMMCQINPIILTNLDVISCWPMMNYPLFNLKDKSNLINKWHICRNKNACFDGYLQPKMSLSEYAKTL